MRKLILILLFISQSNKTDDNNVQQPILNQETVKVYLLNTLNDSRGYFYQYDRL